MPLPTERRETRISTQELRHHLRDADQDRFRLSSALAECLKHKPLQTPLLGVVVLLAVAFGLTAWTVNAPPAATPQNTTPVAADVIQPKPAAVRPVSRVPAGSVHTEPHQTIPVRTPSRPRLKAKLPTLLQQPRRAYPRPLSPAEFGRKPEAANRSH